MLDILTASVGKLHRHCLKAKIGTVEVSFAPTAGVHVYDLLTGACLAQFESDTFESLESAMTLARAVNKAREAK
jgi:hypothetical protein